MSGCDSGEVEVQAPIEAQVWGHTATMMDTLALPRLFFTGLLTCLALSPQVTAHSRAVPSFSCRLHLW